MSVMWKFSEDARKFFENVYTFFVEEKKYGLKMSLECAFGRTAALTGVSRATAQIIVSKKVRLPSPLTRWSSGHLALLEMRCPNPLSSL